MGCGIELWRAATGARGATAYALAPEGEAPGWVTLTLARAAGQDPFFDPAQAVRTDPVWGRSLESLANGGFRLEGARATADRRLSLGAETLLRPGGPSLAGLLATHPGLFVEVWSELAGRLTQHVSPSLRVTSRAVPSRYDRRRSNRCSSTRSSSAPGCP